MSSENVTCVSEIISQLASHYAGKLLKLMCSKYSGTELIVIGRPEKEKIYQVLSSSTQRQNSCKLFHVVERKRTTCYKMYKNEKKASARATHAKLRTVNVCECQICKCHASEVCNSEEMS